MSGVPPALIVGVALLFATLVVLWAVRINGGLHFTPFLACTAGMVGLHVIGAGLLAAQWTERPFTDLQVRHGLRLLFVICAGTTAMLAGAVIATMRVRRTPAGILTRWAQHDASDPVVTRHTDLGMAILGALSVGLMLLYFRSLESIPLVAVLVASGAVDPGALRSQATTGYAGAFWRYDLAMSLLLPVVAWYFLARAHRQGGRLWLVFWAFFAAACLGAIGTLVKSPIIVFVGLSVVVSLVSRGRFRARPRVILLAVVAFLVMMPALFALTSPTEGSISKHVRLSLSRAATGQVFPGLFYLDYFPTHSEFLGGRGLPNPGGLLGFEPVRVPRLLWTHYFADDAAAGRRLGNNNTSFLFSLFANFGLPGVLAGAAFAGALLVLLPALILRLPIALALRIAMFALVCREAFRLAITSMELSLLSAPTVAVLAVLIALGLGARLAAGVRRATPSGWGHAAVG